MKIFGKITGTTQDWKTKDKFIIIRLFGDLPEEFEELKLAEKLEVVIEKFAGIRSKNANSYFHKLVELLANKLKISKIACKNRMITRYGQTDYLPNGDPVVIKTNIPPVQAAEIESLHLLPFKADPFNLDVTFYRVYRGSHTYNTREMSILIRGTIDEAQDQGIQTATPDEVERMLSAWESQRNKGK